MADIEATIQAKEQQIRQLQEDVALLKRARELCGSVVVAQGTMRATASVTARATVVKQDSQIGLAIAALREAKNELHIDELVRVLNGGGHKIDKVSLVGTLARMVKKGRLVYRSAPNTFALLEWKAKPAHAIANGDRAVSGVLPSW